MTLPAIMLLKNCLEIGKQSFGLFLFGNTRASAIGKGRPKGAIMARMMGVRTRARRARQGALRLDVFFLTIYALSFTNKIVSTYTAALPILFLLLSKAAADISWMRYSVY